MFFFYIFYIFWNTSWLTLNLEFYNVQYRIPFLWLLYKLLFYLPYLSKEFYSFHGCLSMYFFLLEKFFILYVSPTCQFKEQTIFSEWLEERVRTFIYIYKLLVIWVKTEPFIAFKFFKGCQYLLKTFLKKWWILLTQNSHLLI